MAISPNSFITIAIFAGRVARMCRQQCRLAAAEWTGDESDGRAKHVKNDGVRMKNDELMTKPK